MKIIIKLFLRGLVAILPLGITIYILYLLGSAAETVLGNPIQHFLPEGLYVTGMGVIAGFLVILIVGVLLQAWFVRSLFRWGESLLQRVPLVKFLYKSIRDLMEFFDTSKKKKFSKVVMVTFAHTNARLLGLATREDFQRLPEGIGTEETIAVYLPMSYQMGGFTVMVPKSQIEQIDMSIEEAMRFCLTAALSTETGDES